MIPLPPQPDGVPWPTDEWPRGEPPAALAPLLDAMFDPDGDLTRAFAVVVVHRGRLVAERYADVIEHFDAPDEPITAATPLLSWSMAKSVLHALVGMLVEEDRLELQAPADVPTWRAPDDPRRRITLDDLLAMRDGLDFIEDYVDASRSDVIEMLFARGKDDVARFAADRALAAKPGERFNYSSGTTNVVSGIVARVVGPGRPYEEFLQSRLFDAIGMRSARATFDDAGTFIASSFVYCTAQDFVRFGTLYLRDGVWDGRRLLPEGWVDIARRLRSTDADTGNGYGSHWWVDADDVDGFGTFWASGYEGQSIMVVPGLDLVVVRLGKTEAARGPLLRQWRRDVRAVFAGVS
ncbi:MAG TPA: serine hydrolase [Acidimicrobiales bacterium]|nr:serine hydrolase [Acidimicrobiales bacterium]